LLHPSQTLAAERAEREREELRAALADMGDRGVAEVCRRAEALCAYQEAEESEDVIAALPRLTLEDIPKTVTAIPTSAWELDGVKIVNHDISTSGIIYLDLYFDVSDITPCEVFALSNMTNLSGNLPTAAYSLGELEHHLKCDIGVLSISFYKLLCKEGTRLYI
jgi:Zn-dependent M16 (insulinase) family peptidase